MYRSEPSSKRFFLYHCSSSVWILFLLCDHLSLSHSLSFSLSLSLSLMFNPSPSLLSDSVLVPPSCFFLLSFVFLRPTYFFFQLLQTPLSLSLLLYTVSPHRHVRMVLPSTWSTCCSMVQTPPPRMQQETLHFTLALCIIR